MNRIVWLACLSFACSSNPEELAWPADMPGEYAVGYTSRPVTYTTENGSQRELRLAIWYPAQSPDGPAVSYLEAFERPDVHQGAPPIDHAIATVLWSHGNLAFAEASGFLGEYLATHGIVTLAPDHTGNTIMDVGEGTNAATFAGRPQDMSAVLDWWLARGGSDPLTPLVNERVVIGGHSFGGYTALAATGGRFHRTIEDCGGDFSSNWCNDLTPDRLARFEQGFEDKRIEANLLYNSGSGTTIKADTVTVPTLMFTAGKDAQTPNSSNGDPLWADLGQRPGNVRIDDPMSGHNTLTVMCEIAPALDPDGVCEADHTPWMTAWQWSNTYALAFIRHVLWGHAPSQDILTAPPLASGLTIERP